MALQFPSIYLLQGHLDGNLDELHRLERQLDVVFNTDEAEVFLADVKSATRAKFELRKLQIYTEDAGYESEVEKCRQKETIPRKRRKVTTNAEGKDVVSLDSSSESDAASDDDIRRKKTACSTPGSSTNGSPRSTKEQSASKTIKVLRLAWYKDSVRASKLLPINDYLLYEGRVVSKSASQSPIATKQDLPWVILARAKANPATPQKSFHGYKRTSSGSQASRSQSRPGHLLHETTFEHDYVAKLPPIPNYVHLPYCCQRPTPLHCPNEEFLNQLRIIQKSRKFTGEAENGHPHSVRAYQGAISSISCFPRILTSVPELSTLPRVGPTVCELFQEFKTTGQIQQVVDIENDERFQSLCIFNGIYDVGEHTAREFYNKGWRTIHDVISYGWKSLTRTQQIGVKFYYEFEERISRREVEKIANHVLSVADTIYPGFEMVICGGYRKGQADCGDVDVMLSHRDEEVTTMFLDLLLHALEDEGSITHTLQYTAKNSKRGQNAVSSKGNGKKAGSGFDTLDHAFVAWQDQDWSTKAEDLKADPKAKNPNIHRRVDILVTPWKTAGCAILGWSGGTMFERDLRHYCHKVLGYKFDTSGVRRDTDTSWVDLEKGDGDMVAKERRLFDGLNLISSAVHLAT
ncbi:hypothetical protein BJ875DRAFT_205614 [Amylocarpus encephaloides]|uniref:DNA polymerase n=1 Tax=Amylocarpus encephaloides TaxID=45428 RepID=A0A9P8C0H4_9HELO|nr:hypothetical protein BJ875DRAFT_205614 [Amylocarpus encephaloides]